MIVADRFYNDFSLLNIWDSNEVFFVIRHKENLQFTSVKENELPENRHEHIMKDELIELKNEPSKNKYPKKLRRVAVWDEENGQVIELITNQFYWSPNTIGELYKSRWQVEIFFRDIKAATSYKILYRNIRKCCYDSNLDGFNYHSHSKSIKSTIKI